MRLTSLRQRFYIMLLLPVAILLSVFGYLAYSQFHRILLQEWQETALVKLEHAATQLDLRLATFRRWFDLFNQASLSAHSEQLQSWFLHRLRHYEGVAAVRIDLHDSPGPPAALPQGQDGAPGGSLSLSPARVITDPERKTVTLLSIFLNPAGRPVGQLEVAVQWSFLLQGLFSGAWFQTHQVLIINDDHEILFASDPALRSRRSLGDQGDLFERALLKEIGTRSSGLLSGQGAAAGTVAGYYRLPQTPWTLLLLAQKEEVLAPVSRFRFYFLSVGVLCLLAILAFIRQLICPIIMSIREISRATLQIAEGHYGLPLPEERQDELGQLTRNFNIMVAGLKERDYIKDTFGRYVDPEVARALLSRPEAALLGGERRFVAILFADLRDFTSLAETQSPEATISLVNRFFSRMVEVIRRHQGIIVDFYGDGLLAFFEPFQEEALGQCVDRCRRCALDMQAAMQELNASAARRGFPPLSLGVGVHAGEAVVGNIGSETRAKYGVVGSAVNLTHRIQGQAQAGEVVLSAAAYNYIDPPPPVQRTFQAQLKGVREPLTLHVLQPGDPGA